MARAFDIGVTAWGALGSGVLTGKYNKKNQQNKVSEPNRVTAMKEMLSEDWANAMLSDRNMSIAEEVQKIADEIGHSPAQVALSWVRQQKGVIVPIIGARKVSQLKDNLGCLDFELTQEQLQRLDTISKIELGFPHDFLASKEIRNIVYGETLELIDNHRS